MKKHLHLALLLIFIFFIPESCISPDQRIRVSDMRCEYLVNPPGVDVPQPRFSWIITCARRGTVQSAYRIKVSGPTGEKVWDSGKVMSNKTTGIAYQGASMESGQKYTWKVWVWDERGHKETTSRQGWFQTGLFHRTDWKAKWISAADTSISAPLFRKEFKVEKKIQHAWVYVTGLGQYELYLNGQKVGDHVLDPGRTDFRKRVLYATYDVAEQLKQGINAVGIILGNGTYRVFSVKDRYGWSGHEPRTNPPRALMQLDLIYADGSKSALITDDTWKSSASPITFNHVYGGEDYDARLEQHGWSAPGFDDSEWSGVAQIGRASCRERV